jgi:hypothetical protein
MDIPRMLRIFSKSQDPFTDNCDANIAGNNLNPSVLVVDGWW